MLQLSSDATFHFEILRDLSLSTAEGADVGELLVTAPLITPGDFESYTEAFYNLSSWVYSTATAIDANKFPVSARTSYLRAATYFRSAEFFLRSNWSDPRIQSYWELNNHSFCTALPLFPYKAQRLTLHATNFSFPAVYYSSGLPGKRPTLILGNGYDGGQEELYHYMVRDALERGFNCITYEGPGQPSVRINQGLGFINNWEAVITPVVDYLLTRSDVHPAAISLMGLSLGGYLAPRAAAFEHRLAAVIALNGVFDFGPFTFSEFPSEIQDLYTAGNVTAFNEAMEYLLASSETSTGARWGIEQGMWAFNTPTPYEWITAILPFTLENVYQSITCPVFVGDSSYDIFFPGQAELLAQKLGSLATYHLFTNSEGGGEHAAIGASNLRNQVVFDWLETTLGL